MHVAHGKGSPRHCLPAYLPKTRAAQVTARAAKSKISYTKNRVKVSRTPLYSQKKSAPCGGLSNLHLPPPHAAAHYTYTRPKQKKFTLHFKQPRGPQRMAKSAEASHGAGERSRPDSANAAAIVRSQNASPTHFHWPDANTQHANKSVCNASQGTQSLTQVLHTCGCSALSSTAPPCMTFVLTEVPATDSPL